jgi:hypothetical protein
MKKEVKFEKELIEHQDVFFINFKRLTENYIEEDRFETIMIDIDFNPVFIEPYIIKTYSFKVIEIKINFINKPNEEDFLNHIEYVFKQVKNM